MQKKSGRYSPSALDWNLVRNGTFETGSHAPWVLKPETAKNPYAIESDYPVPGHFGFRFIPPADVSIGIETTIITQPGQHHFSLNFFAPEAGESNSLIPTKQPLVSWSLTVSRSSDTYIFYHGLQFIGPHSKTFPTTLNVPEGYESTDGVTRVVLQVFCGTDPNQEFGPVILDDVIMFKRD